MFVSHRLLFMKDTREMYKTTSIFFFFFPIIENIYFASLTRLWYTSMEERYRFIDRSSKFVTVAFLGEEVLHSIITNGQIGSYKIRVNRTFNPVITR